MSARRAFSRYWPNIVYWAVVIVGVPIRLVTKHIATSAMQPVWSWVDANMVWVSIVAACLGLAVFFYNRARLMERDLAGFQSPEASVYILDAIERVRESRLAWRKAPDDLIVGVLFAKAGAGNLRAWGFGRESGSGDFRIPTEIPAEFFHSCNYERHGGQFQVESLSTHRRYDNILLDEKQLDAVTARLRSPKKDKNPFVNLFLTG